jgi:hypothetical protein
VVPTLSEERLAVKLVATVALAAEEFEIVGVPLLDDQQMPVSVTAAPPLEVMDPPPMAEVVVIEEKLAFVVTVGTPAKVVKLTGLP